MARTLAELIEARRGGRSFQRLEDEAPGNTPSSSRWHQLARRPLRGIPEDGTIIGIAEVLGVSPFDVLVSCAASLGWPTGPQKAELLERMAAYDVGGLTGDEVEVVISMVAVLLNPSPSSLRSD
jgi:hypothetical protein